MLCTIQNVGMLTKNNNKTTKAKRSRKERKASALLTMKDATGSWKEVRAEKVARAKKLLQDPAYPSGQVLNSIARLLARHLDQ